MLERQEKEARIEDVSKRAMRRMANQGVMAAFTQWQEEFFVRQAQERTLRSVGARMAKPRLVAVFNAWQDDWDRTQRKMERLRAKAEAEMKKHELACTKEQLRQAGCRYVTATLVTSGTLATEVQLHPGPYPPTRHPFPHNRTLAPVQSPIP